MTTVTDIRECTSLVSAVEALLDMLGINYNELAEQMGYSKMHVYNVCHGRYDMNIRFAKKLAEVSHIEPIFWIGLYLNDYDN